jgi:hypothetical protein
MKHAAFKVVSSFPMVGETRMAHQIQDRVLTGTTGQRRAESSKGRGKNCCPSAQCHSIQLVSGQVLVIDRLK